VLEGMRLVVTGGTGFVGSAFVRHCVTAGATVTVIARPTSDLWRLASIVGHHEVIRAGIGELGGRNELRGADAFVHLAAAGVNQSFDDVEEMVSTNVIGTASALRSALDLEVGRFVLVGTSGEYGPGVLLSEDSPLRPTSEYGATRAAATLLTQTFGARRALDVVVVRPFAVYGPYEAAYRLLPYAILRGLGGLPIDISSGRQTRDYVHVDDVASGLELASCAPAVTGCVLNLCSGVETSVRAAAALAAELAGRGAQVRSNIRPPIPGEMWRTTGDPTRARDQLGWRSRSLAEGLGQTVAWFRDGGRNLAAYAQR